MKNDIFISYSRYDSDVVNEIVTLLEQEGYSVWIDRDGIESGEDFKRVILRAIKESVVILFFSSEHSNVSDWTAKEIGVAVKYKKHIIPIMLDDSNFNEAVEFDLINLDYVDYSKALTRLAMRERLFKALRNKLGVGSKENEQLETERLVKGVMEKKQLDEEGRNGEIRLSATNQHLMKVPEGAIKSFFSVSSTKKVYFSKGNLQYQPSIETWRFAENQYDIIAENNVKIYFNSKYNGWIDLFGWGTGDNPIKKAYDSSYYQEFTDWGSNRISNGGNRENIWTTMTREEWLYVFEERQTLSGIRFAKVKVNGVNGLLLLPDYYEDYHKVLRLMNSNRSDASFESNVISASDWSLLEDDGVVFLPAAGYRHRNSVCDVGSFGYYWSASFNDRDYANNLYFFAGGVDLQGCSRCYGRSVRLVCPVE